MSNKNNKIMQNLKNILITVILAAATGVTTYAQDIIITVKAEKIEAIVTEIDIEVVRYKQYDFQDGPTFVIKKSDIASILFQNGQVIVFERSAEEPKPQEPIPTEETVYNQDADYKYFKSLYDSEMASFLKRNDADIYEHFRYGVMQKRTGKIFIIPCAVFGGVALYPLFWGVLFDTENPFRFYGLLDYSITIPAVVLGTVFLIGSISLQIYGENLKKQAKNKYENKYFKNTTSLNFNLSPTGFGMSLKF